MTCVGVQWVTYNVHSVHIMYIIKNLRDFSSGNFNYIKLSYHERILEPMYVHIKDEPVNFYSFKQKKNPRITI